MGRDANLVNDGRHLAFQAGAAAALRFHRARGHHLFQPLAYGGQPAGLCHVKVRSLGRGHVNHAALDIAGQYQYPRLVAQLCHLVQYVQPVDAGEDHFHHHSVGFELLHHAQKLVAIPSLADYLKTWVACQRSYQVFAEFRTRVSHYNPFDNLHVHYSFAKIDVLAGKSSRLRVRPVHFDLPHTIYHKFAGYASHFMEFIGNSPFIFLRNFYKF